MRLYFSIDVGKVTVFSKRSKSCMIGICGFIGILSSQAEVIDLKFYILLRTKMFIKCAFCNGVDIAVTLIGVFRW